MNAKTIQNLIVATLLIAGGIFIGYYLGQNGYEARIKTVDRKIEIVNKQKAIPSSVDFAQFWKVWDMVNQKHISRPIDPTVLLDGAIHGMVESVGDPYTNYLNVEENKETKDALNGHYEGIGAQLGLNDEKRLIVIAPLDGSPAERAGIRAGDSILEIDGESTAGYSISEAVNKIRGAAGTPVKLTIYREGLNEPTELELMREEITVDSVTWEDKGDGIAYLRVSRFGETTNEEWEKAVNEITTQMPNLKGIVLDVRNNPGGFLESAVYLASEFVDSGVVVKEDFSDGTKEEFTVDHKGKFTDDKLKVTVLMNEGSASASEILAGALKERIGATLLGERSFGKGSVQSAEELGDGTSLHVSVAKWLTPKGNWVSSHNAKLKDSDYNETDKDGKEIIGGLKPDQEVIITDEDLTNKYDRQLEEALKYLKGN